MACPEITGRLLYCYIDLVFPYRIWTIYISAVKHKRDSSLVTSALQLISHISPNSFSLLLLVEVGGRDSNLALASKKHVESQA